MGFRLWRISFIVLCCFLIIVQTSVVANSKNQEYVGGKKATVSKMVKGFLPISTSSKFTSKYWGKIKTLIHQGRGYFPSPNLDFRKANNAEVNEEGIGGKVKEAAMKSMGKSKSAIEDSAEKTAKVVGETSRMMTRSATKRRKDQSEL